MDIEVLQRLSVNAKALNDSVWKGRMADELGDDEITLAMATREINQDVQTLLLDEAGY